MAEFVEVVSPRFFGSILFVRGGNYSASILTFYVAFSIKLHIIQFVNVIGCCCKVHSP